jgi:hypothetical protein
MYLNHHIKIAFVNTVCATGVQAQARDEKEETEMGDFLFRCLMREYKKTRTKYK